MTEVLISLRYCAISLGLQLAWKLGKVPPIQTYPVLVGNIVEYFEKKGLWREAQELAELALSMVIEDADESDILKINRWLSIQQLGHAADTIAEIRAWEPADKPAEAVKAALLREYSTCITLLKEVLRGPRVVQLRRWYKEQPLMQRAMSEEPKVGRLLGNISKPARPSKRKR
jgi:hypothetical protein